ncbi:MAG: queuosine precursor transporter [Actinomycetaceae bacterium]|nr:queuosine precursor transporter [Actinomycetaceae bacterium]
MTDTHPQSRKPAHFYDVIAVAFVAFLLISNIAATKLIAINVGFTSLIFDGGAILFPLTYILGDVLAEVYGFPKARRAILMGFIFSILASLIFLIVGAAPPAADYLHQDAFVAVLGFVPRIVAASVLGYLAGQLLNAWILVRIKQRFGAERLWVRLIGSTLVGELADTLIFCTIAFYGVITGAQFLNYVLVGYFYKVAVEVLALPVTYPTLALVKRLEARGSYREVA